MTDIKKILVIEAGGMKGIIPIAFLAYVEEHLKISIRDYFDLIVGTSTGGIIAIGIANGIAAKDILNFYESDGAKIFKKNIIPSKFRGFWGCKYDVNTLKKIIKNLVNDSKMKDLTTRVIIPTVNTQGDIIVFKTPHCESYYLDRDKLLSDVLMSSISAPLFFKSHEGNDNICYTDGALCSPNPVDSALIEGIKYLNWKPEQIKLLNLGCGKEPISVSKNIGKLKAESDLLPLVMKSLVNKDLHIANFVMRGYIDNIYVISPEIEKGKFLLDTTNKKKIEELKNLSSSKARKVIDNIKPIFFENKIISYKND